MEVKTDFQQYRLFVATVFSCSFMIAFICGMFIVVVMPHWPRAAYAGLVLGVSAVAGGIVSVAWYQEAPHLLGWGLSYMVGHFGAQALGGIGAVFFGRPLARLGVQMFLPPAVRPRLAFLWLADGKPPPSPGV